MRFDLEVYMEATFEDIKNVFIVQKTRRVFVVIVGALLTLSALLLLFFGGIAKAVATSWMVVLAALLVATLTYLVYRSFESTRNRLVAAGVAVILVIALLLIRSFGSWSFDWSLVWIALVAVLLSGLIGTVATLMVTKAYK